MKLYEKILGKMSFTINSTLISNDHGRNGNGDGVRIPEEELLKSSRRAYMELKVMMIRLENALFSEESYGKVDKTEVSDRNTSASNNTKSRKQPTDSGWASDFSC